MYVIKVILIGLVEYLLNTVDRKIRIGCLNVDGTSDNNYWYPDDCKNISRHISSNTGCYYTPDKNMVYYIKVELIKKLEYMIRLVCLTKYGWCWWSD